MTTQTILVIGATGKTGKRIKDRLLAQGYPVRSATRNSDIPFDWEQPATWPRVLDGIKTAYLAYSPDLAVPSALGVITAFVEAARMAGLQRIVLLSERNEDRAQACEQVVIASGLEWTILRPSWFAQNFSEGGFLDGVLQGEVSLPDAGAAEPFVDLEDLADVAVAALCTDDHLGEIYEITGPDLLTWPQAVALISQAMDRPIAYTTATPAQFQQTLTAAGYTEQEAAFIAQLVARILDGRNAQLGDGVQRALGRKPRAFASFVADAQASGCWLGVT